MLLEFGDQWLNVDAMKALYLDTRKDGGGDYASVSWIGSCELIELGPYDEFNLHPGQMAAIEAALRAQNESGR